MTLPALSVTDRHALKALTIDTSTIIEPGRCWLCDGRNIVAFRALDKVPFPLPRNILRAQKVSAQEVISLFTPDHHPVRHAEGGTDDWWNLKMRRRGADLKAKDNRDTSEIAKNDRVTEQHRDHLQAMARKLVGPSPFADLEADRNAYMNNRLNRRRSQWPQGRKLQSRGFQRRGTK